MKLGNPKEVIHDAYAIGLLSAPQENYGTIIDRSPASSANNTICNYLEAGRIVDVVESAELFVKYWLKCAYAPDDNNTVNLASHLGDELFRKYFQTEKEKRHPKLRRLSKMAVLDYKMRVNNGNPLTQVFMSSSIGVGDNHYVDGGWFERVKRAQVELARLDMIGLEAVRVDIRKLRYGE